MADPGPSIIAFAAGLVLLLSWILFRRGRLRYQARGYWDPGKPTVFRNAPFAQIWVAAAFLSMGIILLLPASSPLVFVAVMVMLLSTLIAFVWVIRPPEYAKPRWIRTRETIRAAPGPTGFEQAAWWPLVALVVASILIIVGMPAIARLFP